jgi:hypothetical protein
MRSNLRRGTEKVRVFAGTNERAETSNNPRISLGLGTSLSRKEFCTIEEQPEPKGAMTLFGSVSSKFAT